MKLTFLFRDMDVAEVQLVHVQNVLESYGLFHFQNLPLDVRVELSATLLAAAAFTHGTWKERTVHLAKKIIEDLPLSYLHPWVARGQVSFLRRPEDIDQPVLWLSQGARSRGALKETDVRLYAQCGRLTACLSDQLLRRNRIDLAQALLQQWQPRSVPHPPKLERMANFHYRFSKAKVLRLQGDLKAAVSIFFHLLQDDVYLNTTRWIQSRITSHSADVLCELNQPHDAITLSNRLIRDDFCNNDLLEPHKLSIAEAFAQTDRSEMARRLLLEIKDKYDKTAFKLSRIAEMTHVRACIGLARISHGNQDWQLALADWNEASTVVQKYKWGGEFTNGIIQYSLSHVTDALLWSDLSRSCRETSKQILRREGCQYWMPLVLGTRWSDFARCHLKYDSSFAFLHGECTWDSGSSHPPAITQIFN